MCMYLKAPKQYYTYVFTHCTGASLALVDTDSTASVVEGNSSSTMKEICLRLDDIMGGLQRGIAILATARSDTTGESVINTCQYAN